MHHTPDNSWAIGGVHEGQIVASEAVPTNALKHIIMLKQQFAGD